MNAILTMRASGKSPSPPGILKPLAAVLVLASPPLSVMGQGFTYDVAVFRGDPAPDGNGILSGIDESGPILNNAGRVAFRARSQTPESAELVVAYGGGSPATVLFRGGVELAPDGNGIMESATRFTMNSSGVVAFRGGVSPTGPDIPPPGIFRTGPSLVQIARGEEAAPGGNGFLDTFPTSNALDSAVINSSGQVALYASLAGTTGGTADDFAVYLGNGGTLTEVVREGTAIAGIGTPNTVGRPTINDAGQVATRVTFSFCDNAILRYDGTGHTVIARSNQPAPDANGSIDTFGNQIHAINSAGMVAYQANFKSTANGNADNSALVVGDGLTSTLIIREGTSIPGGVFAGVITQQSPAINDNGDVAFEGNLEVTFADFRGAIFLWKGGSVTDIVRTGDPAPDGNGTFSRFDAPSINNSGDVVFHAVLTGTAGEENTGIFHYQAATGTLSQVVRRQQVFEGSSIAAIDFRSEPHFGNTGSGLNDSGQVAFYFNLNDGRSGIAVANPPPAVTISITSTSGGPGNFTLNWIVSNGGGVDIYRSPDLVNWGAPIAVNLTAGTFTDVTAPSGASFYTVVLTGTPYP